MGKDPLDDLRIPGRMLFEHVLQASPAEPREECGEVSEEDRPRRALVDFEPVYVRSRPLTYEPTRDDRALPDPRDPGHHQHAGGRGGPGVEGLLLFDPSEDSSETAQRGAPEDGRGDAPSNSVGVCEVEGP